MNAPVRVVGGGDDAPDGADHHAGLLAPPPPPALPLRVGVLAPQRSADILLGRQAGMVIICHVPQHPSVGVWSWEGALDLLFCYGTDVHSRFTAPCRCSAGKPDRKQTMGNSMWLVCNTAHRPRCTDCASGHTCNMFPAPILQQLLLSLPASPRTAAAAAAAAAVAAIPLPASSCA